MMYKNMDMINKDIDIITNLFNKYNDDICDIDRENYSAGDLNDLYENIADLENDVIRIERGCTKMVFIPFDSQYVYKIPFLGDYGLHEEYDDNYNDNYTSYSDIDPDFHKDFCDIEVDRCRNICDAGFEDYVAKEEYFGKIDGFSIYIQEKGKTFFNIWSDDDVRTEEEKDIVKEVMWDFYEGDFNLPDRWVYDFAIKYGIDETIDFLNYLLDNGYNDDLHYGNIGYIGGRPVLIDYSGYIYQWGWTEY